MSTPPPTDHEQLAQAIHHFNAGDLGKAGLMAQALYAKDPKNAEVIYLLGMIASRAERLQLAVKLLEMAIELQPKRPFFHFHLGEIYGRQNRADMAEEQYRQAIHLKPDFVVAYINLGSLLLGRGDQKAAMEAYLTAVNLDPSADTAFYNLGIIAQKHGSHTEALQFFDQALQAKPQTALTHTARAFSLLMMGRFQEGWPAYEWRWHLPNNAPRICAQPRWDGSNPKGKRLYLYTEQGFGDALMFVRYVKPVRQQGAIVILECKPEMFRLFQGANLADELVARAHEDETPPTFAFDQHLPLLNVPVFFTTSLQTIPSEVPYLYPDPDLKAQWRERLKSLKGLRVALSWSGNPEISVNHDRACTFQAFQPLLQVPGISFVSVQKGAPAQQWRESQAVVEMLDLDPQLTDFAETAAVLANVDLLISTDTAVVHLAGALGIPVWTVLHTASEWRWMQHRLDSPWYPSMRLFRQTTPGDWREVIGRIEETLRAWMATTPALGATVPSKDD